MTVKTEDAAAGRSGTRASGRGPGPTGTVEHLSRADRVARGKAPGRWPRWNRTPRSGPTRGGTRSGCSWARPRRGCPSWCRSATAGCWRPRSPSTGARRCRWRPTSRRRAVVRAARAAVRGRPPVELRGLRHPRTPAGVRRQRLRRDRCPGRSSGTSSGWPRAWPWPGGTAGFTAKDRRKIALRGGRTLPHRDARVRGEDRSWTSGTRTWTSSRSLAEFRSQVRAKSFKIAEKLLAKAHTSDSTKALGKLTTVVDGQRRIISDPPMIVPIEEVFAGVQADAIYELLRTVLGKYRRTLQSDRRHLLEQFTTDPGGPQGRRGRQRRHPGLGPADGAANGVEPLFLQAKEAQPSVLADYAGRSQYNNQGERVVAGQHLMQAAERHLPRLGPRRRPRRRGGPRLLRPPAEGLEVLRADRA